MDRSPLILSALDELRQIRSDTRLCSSLDAVRRIFDRLQEIRRQHLDDFDLQIIIADAQQEIIERARVLRKGADAVSGDALSRPQGANPRPPIEEPLPSSPFRPISRAVRPPEQLSPDEQPAEIPPEVPKLEKKSWQLAVGLAVLFTVGIFASFFYLIQTARRLNFQNQTPAVATQPQAPAPLQARVST